MSIHVIITNETKNWNCLMLWKWLMICRMRGSFSIQKTNWLNCWIIGWVFGGCHEWSQNPKMILWMLQSCEYAEWVSQTPNRFIFKALRELRKNLPQLTTIRIDSKQSPLLPNMYNDRSRVWCLYIILIQDWLPFLVTVPTGKRTRYTLWKSILVTGCSSWQFH